MGVYDHVGDDDICEPGRFLEHFQQARAEMEEAAKSMLTLSKSATAVKDPVAAQRYDATHKRMVRLIREWNSLEHFREGS